ncbi:MAG: hypothetical protein AAF754_06720 [Pseudomonadota bacterium]
MERRLWLHWQSLNQGGRKPLCDAIYLPAIVATQCNPGLKAQHAGMKAAGKPSKVAIVVVMRKLLLVATTRVSADREWVEIRA